MKKIKMLLIEKNTSALRMAKELNINPSTLSMYLNGWRPMSNTLKKEVAHYLNVEPEKLFDDYHE